RALSRFEMAIRLGFSRATSDTFVITAGSLRMWSTVFFIAAFQIAGWMDALTMQQRGSDVAGLFHAQSLESFGTAAHRCSSPFAKRMARAYSSLSPSCR